MPIKQTTLYICAACEYTNPNVYGFRVIEGTVKLGPQTLVRGSIYEPEVLCISCFCSVMGIEGGGLRDCHFEDKRYQHVDYTYTGLDKDEDKE